jgi:ABC-type dipeptide/oligopeptide/nickel transport system permease subunit
MVRSPRTSRSTEPPDPLVFTSPWAAIFPGLFVPGTVLALNALADALRDALDPRLR